MVRIQQLTPAFAVAGQLEAADFAALAAQGFKSIIANRPDGEGWGQPSASDCEQLATAAGLKFVHLPLRMPDVLEPETATATREAIAALPAPILAFCKSGTRSAIAWAAAAVATEPVETVIAALQQADVQIPGLASELRVRAALNRT